MEGYRLVVKARLCWHFVLLGALFGLLLLAFFPVHGIQVAYVNYDSGNAQIASTESFVMGFASGLFIVFAAFTILQIVSSIRALRNEKHLRTLYIKEHDERSIAIQNLIGGKGYSYLFVVVLLAMFLTALFHQVVVTLTLMAVLCVMALIKGTLKTYYCRKI